MSHACRKTVLTAALAIGLVAAAAAMDGPAIHHLPGLAGEYFRHDSDRIGRPFHIHVRLPERYSADDGMRYPVVYVLDGDSLFPIVAPNHLFLTYDEKLPDAVIVGIGYGSFDPSINRRGFDFSAPAPDARADQGGAPAFLEFLKNELLPTVESRYRIDPARRVLFGQSRGGYLVLYAAFTDPDLFWGGIASNPTFDPGRDRFFSAPASARRRDLGLVVTSGSRDYPELRDAALDWFAEWAERADAPWDLRAVTIEGGTHSAYSASSYRLGISWLFNRAPSADGPGPKSPQPP
jgi:predicted alpha/beta superfamily hydrolase